MKNRKLTVFWTINIQLLIILLLLIFFAPEMLVNFGVSALIAMVGNGACYIGGNVWHAWQKSKYFNSGLVDSEINIGITDGKDE